MTTASVKWECRDTWRKSDEIHSFTIDSTALNHSRWSIIKLKILLSRSWIISSFNLRKSCFRSEELWYNFVDSEIGFVEDYIRSFKNEYVFFAHFYPIWADITPVDKKNGYVRAQSDNIEKLNWAFLTVWVRQTHGNWFQPYVRIPARGNLKVQFTDKQTTMASFCWSFQK